MTGISFSPDGSRFVTSGKDVRIWDAASGRNLLFIDADPSFVDSVIFSPDGRTIITGNHDSIARLWDAADGHVIRRFEHPAPVYMVDFSHDGRYVATAGWDGVARIWDVNTGDEVCQFIDHQNKINARSRLL